MLKIIFWTVIIVLVLSFFGISIQSIIDSPAGQENFGFVGNLALEGWRFIVNLLTDILDWLRAMAD